ncbi:MAG: hypothetical protein ACKVP7_23095 [Hyphomicrobiaceae bacterium]
MKAFLAAVLAVVAIGYASAFILETYQRTVDNQHVGSGARPDPEPKLRDKVDKPKT